MEQILSRRVHSNLLPPKVMPGLIWSCLKRENLLFQPLCYQFRSLVNTFFLKTYELEVLFADSYVKFMVIRLCYGTLAFSWFFVSNIMQNSVFQMHRSIFCWFSSQIFFLCKGFFCPRANLTGNFLPYISCSANKSEQKNHNVVENRQGTTDKRIYYISK